MKAPKFVTELGNVWLLSQDDQITLNIKGCGRLAWDSVFGPLLHKVRKKRGTVVDIGAYIGDSAAWFDRTHRLVCFEPNREAFTCLAHNLKDAWNIPLPAGNGELVGIEFKENGNLGARTVFLGGEIRSIRLDDLWIDDVVFLKIDTEGWEPNVLEGAKATLEHVKPLVMVEFNDPALTKAGFSYDDIYRFFHGWKMETVYSCGAHQFDILFTPP